MSITAVGPVTALTWALEVGEVRRFSSIKKAISYCGCAPLCWRLLYDQEKRKGNASRATLAVAWKLVAYWMAVDRGRCHFLVLDNAPHLTSIWLATASAKTVQELKRSIFCRKSEGYCRAVFKPAGKCGGFVRR